MCSNVAKVMFAQGVKSDARILIVGTGLTMVDYLLSLILGGHKGPVVAISRRAPPGSAAEDCLDGRSVRNRYARLPSLVAKNDR